MIPTPFHLYIKIRLLSVPLNSVYGLGNDEMMWFSSRQPSLRPLRASLRSHGTGTSLYGVPEKNRDERELLAEAAQTLNCVLIERLGPS